MTLTLVLVLLVEVHFRQHLLSAAYALCRREIPTVTALLQLAETSLNLPLCLGGREENPVGT